MRRLFPLAAVLAVLVPEATASACMNEMVGSRSWGAPVLFGVSFAGVLIHAMFIPLMPTPRIRVLSLMVTGTLVALADMLFDLSSDAIALFVVIASYIAIGVYLGRGGVQDRAKTTEASTNGADTATPQPDSHPEDHDRAA